ncbi:hypothetical protein BURMUCGD2M_4782 [Burkholderia multivorans CGD2M]|uniref:Uncharacterized protein n=1 Tax=Burkholderia multivorans CGD2 TaxID=513052 RepID=B9BI86_9BURK|nr:hypothetical protein BURMUCGD2_4792 [Burkholderia multivorans CGD2]EEE15339.1 hypothetical protein BURMUCGD2M_4782 [Burkholderia multivorans CGD2M]
MGARARSGPAALTVGAVQTRIAFPAFHDNDRTSSCHTAFAALRAPSSPSPPRSWA